MRSVTLRAAIPLSATVALIVACGFAGSATHDGPTDGGPASDGPLSIVSEGGALDAPLTPDGAPRVGCSWPTLQAGAPWPMIGGCVTHAGRSSFRGPRSAPKEIWKADIEAYYPVPSIGADDTVYVPAESRGLLAFSPDGGFRSLDFGGGLVSDTPAIAADGTLFFGASTIAVRRRPDGTNRRDDQNAEVDSSPVLDASGNVYFASFSQKVSSYDPVGTFRWSYDTGGKVNGSPAIANNGDILIGTWNDTLLALTPDGTLRWKYAAGGDNEFRSSPVVADDGTVYIGSMGRKLHAVTPDGAAKWVWQAPGQFDWQMLPALGWDGTIYAATGKTVAALRADGSPQWQLPLEHSVRSQVIVDLDGILYVGADDPGQSRIYAISPIGQLLWEVDVHDPPTGFAIGRDGTLYVTCYRSNRIHAFRE